MKAKLLKILVFSAGITIGLIGTTYVTYGFFAPQEGGVAAGELDNATTTPVQTYEGYILTGHPQLKESTWYLVHSVEGEEARAAELGFASTSVCASASASGVCVPEYFVNQRPARVEGNWNGPVFEVGKLTFTQSLKQ